MTAEQVMNEVSQVAESIRSDARHAIPVADRGDYCRQGDIYLTRIDKADMPDEVKPIANSSLQLAPGETQGSRHCLKSLRGVTLYAVPNAGPLDGPIIEAQRRFTVTHPEHGDRSFPAGVYAVTYQRAFADELRRVQD